MSRAKRLIVMLALVVSAPPARAGDQTLLIELDARSNALPAGVSASGAVVVGDLDTGGAFYWMPTTGVISIGGLSASDVSRNGRTIVGSAFDSRRVRQAAIWERAAEWRLLGSFSPSAAPCDDNLSQATDVTADGKVVVVGSARDGCGISHAFRWDESTGMVSLGSSVAGRASLAQGISADGRVIVGYQDRADGYRQGARWIEGRQELFQGPNGPAGTAIAANRDGSIIVGRVCSPEAGPDPNDQSAWVWTASTGVRCLPAPRRRVSPGPAILVDANATSEDGRVIGGGQNVGGSPDSDAVIWIDGSPSYLKEYLQANGVPNAFATWVNTGAITGISPDGRILVGNGAAAGGFRGYIVILGERP
jgi:probable HAF family extracellular repeat protein